MKPIVITSPPVLNKEQTRDAFSVSETTPLWAAIMRVIQDLREREQADQLAGVVQNNPLMLAASCGAVNTLDNLIAGLEEKRIAANR